MPRLSNEQERCILIPKPVKRINLTLDDDTIALLVQLSDRIYGGSTSLAVREAIES
jgi:hypothetical protein